MAPIPSAQIHAVYQSHRTLCFFHLPSPDPLSSFHRNCNKLTLKSFQHPPGPLRYDSPQWHEYLLWVWAPRCFSCAQTFTWDTLRQTYSPCSVTQGPAPHAWTPVFHLWRHSPAACTDSHHTNMYSNSTEGAGKRKACVEKLRSACLRLTGYEVSSAAVHRLSSCLNFQFLWCLFDRSCRLDHCAAVPEEHSGSMYVLWCVLNMLQ